MKDAQGKTWTRDGEDCRCEDGRAMRVVIAMTDEYILSVINAGYAQAIETQVVAAVQGALDTFAQSRGYDGILSACTYAASSVPKFYSEAQRCVTLRDACWAACYTIMGEVQAGQRAMPSASVVLAELPALTWD